MTTQPLPAAPYSASGFEAGAVSLSVGPDPADISAQAAAGSVDSYRALLQRLVDARPGNGYEHIVDLPDWLTRADLLVCLRVRFESVWEAATFNVNKESVLEAAAVPHAPALLGSRLGNALWRAIRQQLASDATDAWLLGVEAVRL